MIGGFWWIFLVFAYLLFGSHQIIYCCWNKPLIFEKKWRTLNINLLNSTIVSTKHINLPFFTTPSILKPFFHMFRHIFIFCGTKAAHNPRHPGWSWRCVAPANGPPCWRTWRPKRACWRGGWRTAAWPGRQGVETEVFCFVFTRPKQKQRNLMKILIVRSYSKSWSFIFYMSLFNLITKSCGHVKPWSFIFVYAFLFVFILCSCCLWVTTNANAACRWILTTAGPCMAESLAERDECSSRKRSLGPHGWFIEFQNIFRFIRHQSFCCPFQTSSWFLLFNF